MRFLFSDRLWLLKAAAALGLLSLLCTKVHGAISDRFPPLERYALWHDSYRDRFVHLTGERVIASDGGGFEIKTKVGPMRLLTSTPPPVGSFVSCNARAVGPRTFRVLQLDVHSGYAWKRPLNYAISVLTVIVFLWLIRGRFRWQPEQGFFRSRY